MISDADRVTHMLEAIAKMRISLAGMSKAEFLVNDDKKAVAERYTELLSGRPGIRFPDHPADIRRNYAYFPVFFDPETFGETRNAVCVRLNQAGIFPRKYFWPCTNDFEFEKEIWKQQGIPNIERISPDLFDPAKTPTAKRLSEEVLTLPIYGDLDLADVDRICSLILDREAI